MMRITSSKIIERITLFSITYESNFKERLKLLINKAKQNYHERMANQLDIFQRKNKEF